MTKPIRSILASFIACLAIAGCAVGAAPSEGDKEPVSTAQQALASSGYTRTYYTDSTYTTAVGWLNWDCDPNYRDMEGEYTNYYKQYRFDCPGYNDPLLPQTSCYLCSPTIVNGQVVNNCSTTICP